MHHKKICQATFKIYDTTDFLLLFKRNHMLQLDIQPVHLSKDVLLWLWNECILIHTYLTVTVIQMPFLLYLSAHCFLSDNVPSFAWHPDSRHTTIYSPFGLIYIVSCPTGTQSLMFRMQKNCSDNNRRAIQWVVTLCYFYDKYRVHVFSK